MILIEDADVIFPEGNGDSLAGLLKALDGVVPS
jgi:hypothetical protein